MRTLIYRLLNADSIPDHEALHSILMAAPAYSLLVEGHLPSATAAQEMFTALPPGKAYDDKYVLGFYRGTEPIGCADVIRGYPDARIAFIGLLLFAESAQGRAYGPWAITRIRSLAADWGCSVMRIAVIETNARALAFWRREGFLEQSRRPSPGFTGQAIVMECPV